jgi:hypothetical protein
MSGELLIKPGQPGDAALWSTDARGRSHATDADEVGLSDALADRLEEWLDALDGLFDEDVPGQRGFATDTERRAFAAEGHAIAAAIREELGEDWVITVDFAPWEGGPV